MHYLLDTNVIIYILQGKCPEEFLCKLGTGNKITTSIICKLECYAFSDIEEHDKKLLDDFFNMIDVIGLESSDASLLKEIIKIRQKCKLKLPDAIIYSTALKIGATLLTNDKDLLNEQHVEKVPLVRES